MGRLWRGGGIRTRRNAEAGDARGPDAHVDPAEVKVDEGMLRDLGSRPLSLNREPAPKTSRCSANSRWMSVPMPKSACLSGASDAVARRAGDQVRAGQPLVELQSPELGKLRAEYVSAQARVTLAEGALKRKRDLAAEKIAPQREVQEAETEVTQAQAALRSASAALTALGVPPSASGDAETRDAATFGLRSPVAGTVLERNIVQGQMLDPATPAFRIANLSTLWLTVHAFERDAVRIAKGQRRG